MIRKLIMLYDRWRFERRFPRARFRRLHRKFERKMRGQ